jgi:hypothetical protein
VGPDEFEDAAAEFARSVQIVSRLPDQPPSAAPESRFSYSGEAVRNQLGGGPAGRRKAVPR